MQHMTNEIISKQPYIYSYLTVEQFCKKHQAFKVGGMRFQIFNEDKNGLAKSGAVVRMGRKVLIDENKFFHWIETHHQRNIH